MSDKPAEKVTAGPTMQIVKEGQYKPQKNEDGAWLITVESPIREELEGVEPKWLAIEEGKRQLLSNPGLTTHGNIFTKVEGIGKEKTAMFARTFKLTGGLPGFGI